VLAGDRDPLRWGKRESIPITLHYHHQNDSCIQMGSNESRFNVSLIVRDKVTKTVSFALCFVVALRPRKRDGLLVTGIEWEGDDRVKARPRKPPEKDCVHKPQPSSRERRVQAVSNRGSSACQSNALPLGQTGPEGEIIKAVYTIRSGCRPTINLIVCFCTLELKKAPRK